MELVYPNGAGGASCADRKAETLRDIQTSKHHFPGFWLELTEAEK
jgi:hypothetical protein